MESPNEAASGFSMSSRIRNEVIKIMNTQMNSQQKSIPNTLSILVIGAIGVGKSTIIQQLKDREFELNGTGWNKNYTLKLFEASTTDLQVVRNNELFISEGLGIKEPVDAIWHIIDTDKSDAIERPRNSLTEEGIPVLLLNTAFNCQKRSKSKGCIHKMPTQHQEPVDVRVLDESIETSSLQSSWIDQLIEKTLYMCTTPDLHVSM